MNCWLLLVGISILISSCDTGHQDDYSPSYIDRPGYIIQKPIYTFAVHPLHNPNRLFAIYQPLIDIINKNVSGFSMKLVASRDYAAFEQKLYSGKFDFALPNPLQTLNSLNHEYRVIGKMGDDFMFRGIIIVRRDANISTIDDLKGCDLSFPAPTALAATMMPKFFLKSLGLNLSENIVHYVGSQESVIMNVYMGKTLAGGTWPLPWELLLKARPELGEALEVKWLTSPLVNNGLIVHDDIPSEPVKQVLHVILNLHNHIDGRIILERIHISRFDTASDSTYLPVKKFLENYARMFSGEMLQIGVRH